MHFKADPRERNVGRTAEDRLNFCFGLVEMSVEVAISSIQRELDCSCEEAHRRYSAILRRRSQKKVDIWKASVRT